MATFDLGRVTPLYKGDYSASASYELNDVVLYNGNLYWHVQATATVGILPTDTTVWKLAFSDEGVRAEIREYADDAQTSKTAAAQSASQASASASASQASASQAASSAQSASTSEGNASTSASAAATLATNSAASAQSAASSAQTAMDKATLASQKAAAASESATLATAKANAAATSETNAAASAQTATTKASEAAASATSAQEYDESAQASAVNAQTAQGLAEQAQTGAETAQGLAEDARDEAQEIVDGISAKSEQIDALDTRVTAVEGDIGETNERLTDLEETTIPEAADFFIPFSNITKFVQGDINNDGVVSPSVKYRACTNGIIDLQGAKAITIKDGYRIYVRLYNTDGTYNISLGWLTGNVTLSGKVAIAIGKVPESSSAIYPPEELEKGLICKSDAGKTLFDIELSSSYGFVETENILRFGRHTKVINGVTVDVYPYDKMVLNGVCTSGGGRLLPLAEMTLEAGSYYLTVVTEGGIKPVQLCVTKVIGNQTIKYGAGNFTLTETTSVYFGINIVGGETYEQTLKVSLIKDGDNSYYIPPISAIDYKAREQLAEITNTKSAKYNRDNPLRIVSKNGYPWSQGACCVGDKMVGFFAGADDHSTNGMVKISNVFDLTNVVAVSHNLGHACSADYNSLTDTMMIGNGSTDHSTLPMMYLIKNVADWIASPTNLSYNGSNVMTIDISAIGGAVMVCCFGENETIAYVMTVDSDVITIFKCQLGLGANNLTTIYPNDSYGTFISGCGDTEYNGTLHVLASYNGGADVTGEIQGIKYLNGRIIMPTDKYVNGTLLAFISVITLDDATGKIVINKNLWIPMVGADGNPIRTECEDVFFYKGCGYVMTMSTIGTTHYPRTSEFSLALY